MTPEEASQVLARVAAFDRRKPDPAMAEAWAAALDPTLTVADAISLTVAHYAGSRDWLMPADLNAKAQQLRFQRVQAFKTRHGEVYPRGLEDEPGVELRWRQELMLAVTQGADRGQAEAHAWQAINRTPPPIEPPGVRPRLPRRRSTADTAPARPTDARTPPRLGACIPQGLKGPQNAPQ